MLCMYKPAQNKHQTDQYTPFLTGQTIIDITEGYSTGMGVP